MDGVLISGVYGSGKSSVAAEIAERLERRGVPYGAAADVDWLTWFDVPGIDQDVAQDPSADRRIRSAVHLGAERLIEPSRRGESQI
jgi:cytidylate kinase